MGAAPRSPRDLSDNPHPPVRSSGVDGPKILNAPFGHPRGDSGLSPHLLLRICKTLRLVLAHRTGRSIYGKSLGPSGFSHDRGFLLPPPLGRQILQSPLLFHPCSRSGFPAAPSGIPPQSVPPRRQPADKKLTQFAVSRAGKQKNRTFVQKYFERHAGGAVLMINIINKIFIRPNDKNTAPIPHFKRYINIDPNYYGTRRL